MLKIGVTGGIGSGKSMVCRIFAALGVPVYSADDRAKWLLNHDPKLQRSVIELLGHEAYTANGSYDRAWVANQVFQNLSLLQQLNAIVHPRVREDTDKWMKQNMAAPYVVKEAAIMAKAGQNNTLDKIIVVDAPADLRVARVLQRDPQRTEKDIRDIIARQISDEERRQIADYVIYNDERTLLIPQVWKLHLLFKK